MMSVLLFMVWMLRWGPERGQLTMRFYSCEGWLSLRGLGVLRSRTVCSEPCYKIAT